MKGKLVYGFGRYKKGKFKTTENGKHTKAYNAWKAMLKRCYDPKYQAKYPTYAGCSVSDEWLEFQAFARWYEDSYPSDGESYQLDKDLKALGNKIYSPSTCLFVSSAVNKFTTDHGAARGEFLIGVNWNKSNEKFLARCCNPLTEKYEYLGSFTDELQAHLAWRKRKSELAYELAMKQANPEIRDSLLRWKLALDNNEIHVV
jgi:hypothetical protein